MKKPAGPTAENVLAACRKAGFELGPEQGAKLSEYITLLVKWNRVMNLVGHARWQDVFSDLIVDSLHLARFLETLGLPGEPVSLDLGAGAGLPGIPLRVVWPDGAYRLVEVRAKRTTFMRTALAKLSLPGTEVFEGRAEDALEQARQDSSGADLVVSRAFMPWRDVLALVSGGVRSGGMAVFMTNAAAPESAPEGWEPVSASEYLAGVKQEATRYFWAFRAL